MINKNNLLQVLSQPQRKPTLSLNEWSQLLFESSYINMSAQIYYLLHSQDYWDELPAKVREVLTSYSYGYLSQLELLKREADDLTSILSEQNMPILFLKGAAYQLLNLRSFRGRMMSDIDILIPKEKLLGAEKKLKEAGWYSKKLTDYDDRFYRELSQEIPPLKNIVSGITLDVHFNILPGTLKEAPAIGNITQSLQNLPINGCSTLSPAGLMMHSCIHLFYESEFDKGLRDIYDIHLLVNEFASESFWNEVLASSYNWKNQSSLYLALRYSKALFGTITPERVERKLYSANPPWVGQRILDYAFMHVFCQSYPANRKWHTFIAEVILFLRGHLKRMPIRYLIPHLIRKSAYNMRKAFHKEGKVTLTE